MFAQQLPTDIVIVTATDSMWETTLSDVEEQTIARAVDKRKREFRAGRNAAKQALRQLGLQQNIVIAAAQNRRPLWPQGYLGSITHTEGYCAAAVGYDDTYQGIGIDVEPRTRLDDNILDHICTEREQQWIAKHHQADWGKVFFCVKETLYKVFNPIHDVFLGFQEAEVTLFPKEETFSAAIWQRKHDIRCTYQGRFGMDDNFIYASCFLAR